jgi:hypothetical protein
VAERRASCSAFNESHTPPDGNERYHLPDESARGCPGRAPSDSLLAVGFGVRVEGGQVVPLTLVIRFQGSRSAFATQAAAPFVNVIADYFAGPAATSSGGR